MKVYHGCKIKDIQDLKTGASKRFPGLFVTDIFERALNYASSKASGVVGYYSEFAEGAVVAELETLEPVNWLRRESPSSLDECETTITAWRVVKLFVKPYQYENTTVKVDGRYILTADYLKTIEWEAR